MTLIPTAVAMVMSGVLLWAGLDKGRNLTSMAATLGELGFPRRLAGTAALLLMAAEITIALAALFRPDSALTHVGIVILAVLFALAGLIAMSRDEPIRCHCFGAGGKGYLGTTQLIALAPWLAGAVTLRLTAQEAPPLPTGAD